MIKFAPRWYMILSTGLMVLVGSLLVAEVDKTRDAELLAARVLYGAGDAILVCDEHSHVVLFNRAAEKLTGYTAEEIQQAGLYQIMPEEFHAAHGAGMDRALGKLNGTPDNWTPAYRAIVPIKKKDGTVVRVRMSVSGARNKSKIQFVAVFREMNEEWHDVQELHSSASSSSSELESEFEFEPYIECLMGFQTNKST